MKIPLTLDMTPLTKRAVKMRSLQANTNKARAPKVSSYDSVSEGVPSYKYSLFAVIEHEGKLDTGHYKAYCAVRDAWYLFDDHNITSVESAQVLKSNAYMCFYVQQHPELMQHDDREPQDIEMTPR